MNALGGKCTHIELGCNMMCILHLERFPAAVFYYLARRAHCDRTYRQYSSERPGPTALHSERTILLQTNILQIFYKRSPSGQYTLERPAPSHPVPLHFTQKGKY